MIASAIKIPRIPYDAIRYEQDVAVYDLWDVEMYGSPEYYGIDNYIVLDNKECSCPSVLDRSEQNDRRGALRPIHRYSALKRFEYLLRQLLGGCRSVLNPNLLEVVREEMNPDPDHVWNSVRKCLKDHHFQKYVNRIPEILKVLEYPYEILWEGSIQGILEDFAKIHDAFQTKTFESRVYFPSFRFFALKILEHRGCIFEYEIPLMNTPRKIPVFETLWDDLVKVLDS